MPKTKKTDLQVLTALLGMPGGKLTSNEKTVFQRMYDDVAGGMVISLSKKQRAWLDGVYDKHDLDKPQNRGTTRVRVLDKSRLHKEAPKKTPFQETSDGKAQLEAFRRVENPTPENLVSALLPGMRRLIEEKAKDRGKPFEELATAFVRTLYDRV